MKMKRLEKKNKKDPNEKKHSSVFSSDVHALLTEEETIAESSHKKSEHVLLYVRNVFVLAALILFIISLFVENYGTLKGIAYLSGCVAYFCELFMVTDFFRHDVPHKELFMVYCFGPLYLLMGVAYLLGH